MSLRTKTSLFLASLLILILGLVGYWSIRFLENSLRDSIYAGLESISVAQSQAISRFLEDSLNDAQAIASFLPVKALEEKNVRVIEEHLKKALENYPKFQNGMFLLDARGNLWADYPVHPETRGKNFAFREYFKTTMEKQRGIIGVPYRSARTGEEVLTFTALLRGSSNQILGLLGCSVQMLHPNALGGIRKTKIGKHGYVYVFDTSRLMILHPEEERILQRDIPLGANPLLDRAIKGFEGVGETVNSRGVPMLLSLRRIAGTNWIIGVQQPRSEAFLPIKEAQNRVIWGIVVTVFISLLIGVLVVRRLTGPILKLRDIALEIGKRPFSSEKGDLKERLKSLSSSDEIGSLAKAFEEMGERLDETFLSLNRALRDWERTFDSVQDAIFLIDRENRILRINHSASELIGQAPEKVIGQHCYHLIHGTDGPPSFCPHQQTLESGKPATLEVEEPRLKGFFEVTTTPVLDEEGRVVGTVHLMKNITERKRDEEALRFSEEKFSKIYQTSPAGITISSLEDGRYIEVNDAFLRIIGFVRDEIIGRTSIELKIWANPDDRAHFVTELKRKGYVRNRETVLRKKSGELINALISSEVIEIAGEKSILSATLDITDRKKVEESLRVSEERYRSLVESSSDAILLLDLERRILSCNPAFSKLFGYERDEIVGKSAQILHPSEDSFRSFGEHYYPVIHQNGFFRGELELIRKDGEKICVEEAISAIRSPDGTISGYVAILRDMTEKKRMEQEKSLLEEQLRQSQKMEAIGILAGGVAHDFNNLLTVIQGNCEMILFDLSENHPLKRGIEQISGAAHRAANLTRQLLAFSRRQILEPKVFDLNEVIKNLDKMLRRIIGEDIQLITVPARDLGKVRADPSQIEQVILNLVVNARDAMPKGGTLTIETANVELDEHYARTHASVLPGRYVMLSVTDTGVGMTPEVAEKIFEPFFTTKEKGKGTGLGLSTVYGIIKQSGGNIWLYSEPGRGATFKIYLPRVDEPPEELAERKEVSEIPRGRETVLLVEDDENVRTMTAKMLTRYGYRVLMAIDGPQAIRLFEKEKDSIDLILTDVVMPSMGGREMVKQIQRLRPEVKVIYMSGYTDNAIAHHGILEEGIDYIQKPFTLESLLNRVRELLDRQT